MKRYRALRLTGCDPVTAAFIAIGNWMQGHPAHEIHFLGITIEIEDEVRR